VIVKTKLSEKDYINASIAILFARSYTRNFLGIACVVILMNIISGIVRSGLVIANVLPPIIILGIFPAVFYFSIKRGYRNNKRMNESIEYNFMQNDLVVTGESFKSELSWNKVYKVAKTNKWLLIWQTRQIANAIPINNIAGDDLTKLKNILTDNQVVNNL
jgi:hypothetical protein